MYKDPLTLVGKVCGLVHRCVVNGASLAYLVCLACMTAIEHFDGELRLLSLEVSESRLSGSSACAARHSTAKTQHRAPGLLPLAYSLLKQNGFHDLYIIGLVLAVPIVIGIFFVAFIEFAVVPEKQHRH